MSLHSLLLLSGYDTVSSSLKSIETGLGFSLVMQDGRKQTHSSLCGISNEFLTSNRFLGAHHLLAQIPLTVSPYIQLPAATTLPYTYKALPSTLPRSSTGELGSAEKAKYVISASGYAAHPDDILESCRTLNQHLKSRQEDAERRLKAWEAEIKDRELAEKRRIAPGWLDRDERILQPKRSDSVSDHLSAEGASRSQIEDVRRGDSRPEVSSEGEEIDRAFGGLSLK